MFGYIAPDNGRLSDSQKERYRAFYCGLCHSLQSRFGQTGRLSLSNDMTFLAVLLCSLYTPPDAEKSSRCAVHPVRAHTFLKSEWIDYAADMNVLLFWLKCRDQQLDEGPLAGRAGEKVFRKKAARAEARWPHQAAGIKSALSRLWNMERSGSPEPDALCNLSGEMLGACFVPKPDDMWASALRSVGEGLGRFVYWMDAWEDFDSDVRARRFNPLREYHDREDYEEFIHSTLELLIADATEAFEILPLEEDLGLLRNILYNGVCQRYVLRIEKKYGKEAPLLDE